MGENTEGSVLELINKAKLGDKNARSKLVEANIGLVWSIVRRFQNRGYETDDLFQIGCIGLIKAINKFDSSFDVKFSTYAVPMIIGEIKRFIRDDGIIKVSRSLKETSNKVRITKEIMSKELGREPTINEVAERLSITPEDIVMAIEAGCTPESLYSTVGEGDSSPILLIDRLDADNRSEVDLIDKIAVRQILEKLSPREKQIIILRYFKEKTQFQIAKMLGISQVQVSRIEKKILADIRKKINSN
ncbi:RNA polymerase sporulation sigma factor SigF [Clostridium thermosuccinogenes]|jgi:RNA polymerase sporulation-specific sigma factor|uniref:RNA polymerase sigma factor n=2 Tax=Clostridium thermosuccinogenes TaxID=84032 RepID=A0A2K2F573_9CLOT|nr:RNA polymerase sporulation sigma factor SigF [Pseudoclostridium thermosuccinogenes]AUS98849.1 RNA polymerase sporulation sigma factor SigF [Pseudoclostridium thermosuccinogenes]PNT93922.1 RNA polymerase sporulation sigma factor SigF [Pseudoclostridium thermosuccinogenes]PNT97402.1 RNA polymerase sporulation sigma factor SigF [Pseudoclostridium thermosuccinogenes]PNT99338.1 RNA polymerase sporulation sigma factor SigF [Pseudoclostridium thermosuccinogenes]